MSTQDDSKSSKDDFEEEKANVTLMACTKDPNEKIQSKSESESDFEEVFVELSHFELEPSLSKVM